MRISTVRSHLTVFIWVLVNSSGGNVVSCCYTAFYTQSLL